MLRERLQVRGKRNKTGSPTELASTVHVHTVYLVISLPKRSHILYMIYTYILYMMYTKYTVNDIHHIYNSGQPHSPVIQIHLKGQHSGLRCFQMHQLHAHKLPVCDAPHHLQRNACSSSLLLKMHQLHAHKLPVCDAPHHLQRNACGSSFLLQMHQLHAHKLPVCDAPHHLHRNACGSSFLLHINTPNLFLRGCLFTEAPMVTFY